MLDASGEPWTWIMGEHKDDKTIEQIIEEEARESARIQAGRETEQLRFDITLLNVITYIYNFNFIVNEHFTKNITIIFKKQKICY